MTADEALSTIEGGTLLPVYFLHGQESFYHTEIISALTAALITPDNRDFNLESFDARETSVGDWIGSVKTLSFLGGTKLVLVRGLHETTLSESETGVLLEYASAPVTDACLVITAEKIDRKRKLYKTLAGLKGSVECGTPKEPALVPWLKRRAQSRGYMLAPDPARRMVDRIGARPGILASELEKVLTYSGENTRVTANEVVEVVGDIKMENAFALTEALKKKNADQAIGLLHNQLEHGEDPIKVLGMISWQFRVIWEVKHYQEKRMPPSRIAEQMGAKPFLVEKALQHTANFSREKLRACFTNLFQADRELKGSGRDPQGIMETLILKLCSSGS